jgi:hypothetical protein
VGWLEGGRTESEVTIMPIWSGPWNESEGDAGQEEKAEGGGGKERVIGTF